MDNNDEKNGNLNQEGKTPDETNPESAQGQESFGSEETLQIKSDNESEDEWVREIPENALEGEESDRDIDQYKDSEDNLPGWLYELSQVNPDEPHEQNESETQADDFGFDHLNEDDINGEKAEFFDEETGAPSSSEGFIEISEIDLSDDNELEQDQAEKETRDAEELPSWLQEMIADTPDQTQKIIDGNFSYIDDYEEEGEEEKEETKPQFTGQEDRISEENLENQQTGVEGETADHQGMMEVPPATHNTQEEPKEEAFEYSTTPEDESYEPDMEEPEEMSLPDLSDEPTKPVEITQENDVIDDEDEVEDPLITKDEPIVPLSDLIESPEEEPVAGTFDSKITTISEGIDASEEQKPQPDFPEQHPDQSDELPEILQTAKFQLDQGNYAPALDTINSHLLQKEYLDEFKSWLVEAVSNDPRMNPEHTNLWETIGDIAFRQDNPDEALNAYAKAIKAMLLLDKEKNEIG